LLILGLRIRRLNYTQSPMQHKRVVPIGGALAGRCS